MAVTIKDVAKAAGYSHTTVSRALRDSPAISPSTTQHIKQLASEMGYVPNVFASGLKTNRSRVLGVVVRRIDDPFFSRVLNGIEDVLQEDGYSLFLAASHRDADKERDIIAKMSEHRVEGVIICSTRVDEAHHKALGVFGVPSVLVNNQASQELPNAVYHDDTFGCRRICEHLLELGHTRISYLGNHSAGRTTLKRQLGYQAALTNAGILVNPNFIVSAANGKPDGGSEAVEQLLALGVDEMPTAIVCFNDMMAIGAIRGLERAGLSVPHDVSVTGFDDIALAPYVKPSLTTFRQPKYELGRKAAEMILDIINHGKVKHDVLQLRGDIVVRASTAEPKQKLRYLIS